MRTRKKRHGSDRLYSLSRFLYTNRLNVTNLGKKLFDGDAGKPLSETYPEPECPYAAKNPLRLEIGCGKGGFICATAAAEPEYNYVALERITDVIITAMEKYAAGRSLGGYDGGGTFKGAVPADENGRYIVTPEQAGNVRFLNVDAADLEYYFPPESIDTIYINFCDPWTKKGYVKRRLTYIGFLREYLRLLKPGGMLRFKTDDRPLFDFSLEQLEASDFEITASTTDLHASPMAQGNVMTEYERNFSSQGIPINAVYAKKPQ